MHPYGQHAHLLSFPNLRVKRDTTAQMGTNRSAKQRIFRLVCLQVYLEILNQPHGYYAELQIDGSIRYERVERSRQWFRRALPKIKAHHTFLVKNWNNPYELDYSNLFDY